MDITPIVDKVAIESFLRRNVGLHLYGLGDLDERFWPWTEWYGLVDGDCLRALALVYRGLTLPTLLALADEELPELKRLVRGVLPALPARFYLHASPGLVEVFGGRHDVQSHGRHDKMVLKDGSRLGAVKERTAVVLTPQDATRVLDLYGRSYPGTWFEPQMLETGQYFGIEEGGRLISIAGVHVYAPAQRVAALGNITTDPDYRNRGHAGAATAALCRNLLATVEHVGLNVKADNAAAASCYRRLGFERCAGYEEYMVTRR